MMPACARNGFRAAAHLVAGLLLCFLVFASGCDVLAETIFLDRTAEFTFTLEDEAISTEGAVDDTSPEDFDQRLDGFRKDEIVAATIVTARLERDIPAINLDQIFSSVTLVLRLENGQEVTVATQDAMPSQRRVPLDITQEDITAFVRAPNGFYARLEAAGADGIESDAYDEYEVSVELDISIEIEGI